MGRKERERKKTLGNAGFTLIEILLTLAIISVILLPALAAFSTYNSSARGLKKVQRSTSLAENVMESVKTGSFDNYKYSITVLDELADYGTVDSYEADYDSPGRKLATTTAGGASGDDLASCYLDDSGNTQYRSRTDGRYCFVYKGVKDGADTYDVVVKMDSDSYRTLYNDPSMALGKIAGLDLKKTAVITTTKEIEQQAIDYFMSSGCPDPETNMLMNMDITVEGDDSDPDGTIMIKAQPTYTCKKTSTTTEEYTPGYVYSREDFKVSGPNALEKIYILYNQSAKSVKNNSDSINFIIRDGIENIVPKIYIIRQESTNTSLYPNLDIFYTGDISPVSRVFTSGFLSDIRGNMKASELNNNSTPLIQVKFDDGETHSDNRKTKAEFKSISESEIMMDDSSGTTTTGDHSENRIYDVDVTVYKADTNFTEVIASMSSTKRE